MIYVPCFGQHANWTSLVEWNKYTIVGSIDGFTKLDYLLGKIIIHANIWEVSSVKNKLWTIFQHNKIEKNNHIFILIIIEVIYLIFTFNDYLKYSIVTTYIVSKTTIAKDLVK